QEKVIPLLKGIKTKEPAVMMEALSVFREIGMGCDREVVAMDILPTLWAMSFGPLLGLEQVCCGVITQGLRAADADRGDSSKRLWVRSRACPRRSKTSRSRNSQSSEPQVAARVKRPASSSPLVPRPGYARQLPRVTPRTSRH